DIRYIVTLVEVDEVAALCAVVRDLGDIGEGEFIQLKRKMRIDSGAGCDLEDLQSVACVASYVFVANRSRRAGGKGHWATLHFVIDLGQSLRVIEYDDPARPPPIDIAIGSALRAFRPPRHFDRCEGALGKAGQWPNKGVIVVLDGETIVRLAERGLQPNITATLCRNRAVEGVGQLNAALQDGPDRARCIVVDPYLLGAGLRKGSAIVGAHALGGGIAGIGSVAACRREHDHPEPQHAATSCRKHVLASSS